MRRNAPPRYIKPETVCIGDTVRMTMQELDAERSLVGTVASRDRRGTTTYYYTKNGVELGVDYRDGITKLRVTLLNRNSDTYTPELDI